jgi:two-component system chemotaxis response regulator CheB
MKHQGSNQYCDIICVGGETIELGPFVELIRNLPADLRAAIIVIDHIGGMASQLLYALPLHTKMPVQVISHGLLIQPNRVFVLKRGHDLHVLHGKFRLTPVSKPTGWSDVITVFLRSLTHHWPGHIVAVILSGLDGDGAQALGGVKEVGGITFAQKAETAELPEMPNNAIATGYVDHVLSVSGIAAEIVRIARGRQSAEPDTTEDELRMRWRQARRELINLQNEIDFPTFSRLAETQKKLLEATKAEADKCRDLVVQLRRRRYSVAF